FSFFASSCCFFFSFLFWGCFWFFIFIWSDAASLGLDSCYVGSGWEWGGGHFVESLLAVQQLAYVFME
ncbi:hypothetical protein, partial [Pseudomonas sp. QD5]|uniref:hypothetical protein n=1 Tax=Pseudomonas sp. QD5 TaxID=3368619 RepID=UPI003BA382F6